MRHKPSFHFFDKSRRGILCSENKFTIWDLEYSTVIKEVTAHRSTITCSKTYKSKTRLITGSSDKKIKIWDMKTGSKVLSLKGHPYEVTAIDVFHVGSEDPTTHIISGDMGGNIFIWTAQEGKRTYKTIHSVSVKKPVTCLYLFRNSKRFLSGLLNDRIKMWVLKKFAPRFFRFSEFESFDFPEESYTTNQIAMFNNEKEFVTSSKTSIYHWTCDGDLKCVLKGHTQAINIIKLYDQNKKVISGSDDGTIRTWRISKDDDTTNVRVFDVSSPIYSISLFAKEEALITYTSDGVIRSFKMLKSKLFREINLFEPKHSLYNRTPHLNVKRHSAYTGISKNENPDVVIKQLIRTIDKFVPKEFRKLISSGYGYCKLGDAVLKKITVMFTDIRDFTSLSENMSVKELMEFLNFYLAFAIPPIYANNGFVDKFIGDSVMSLFASDNITDQADSALLCAIRIQEDLRLMKRKGLGSHVETGIGINTGKAIIGWIGTETRMEPTVLGDTVNLGSRMESLCKLYGSSIIISEETKNSLGRRTETVTFRHLGDVVVKGRQNVSKIYEVIDGDDEVIQKQKKLLLKSGHWEEGQSLFRNHQFERAIEVFNKCKDICPTDKATNLYIERCRKELKRGNSFDPKMWNPTIRLEQK